MQDTSLLYKEILESPEYWFEYKVTIDSTDYYESSLRSISTKERMLQNNPEIGKAVAGEITLQLHLPTKTIPTMAEIRPWVRACNSSSQSEWLAQGVYYIDTREFTKNDSNLSVLSIHGFDAMLKAEQMYNGRIMTDSTDVQMVDEIAYQMNVNVDSRTYDIMTAAYTIPFPVGYTYREILGYIASMYVGSFIMSDIGELRLVSLLELPPETNLLIEEGGDPIQFGDDCILV